MSGDSTGRSGEFDLNKHKVVPNEISEKARSICNSANRDQDDHPITDHEFKNDVMKITEEDIVDQGKNTAFAGGAPCGDFSRKSNLRMRNGGIPTTDQRSGFKGKTGILFKQLIKVRHWVKTHNPKCDYFIENVAFDDTPERKEVNETFGEPTVPSSKFLSLTARRRAYWTSFGVPESGLQDEARKMAVTETQCRFRMHGSKEVNHSREKRKWTSDKTPREVSDH